LARAQGRVPLSRRGSHHDHADESGAVTGFSKVAHDVTDRKQAEEAVRQSEARFRTLAEGLPQCLDAACQTGAAIT